MSRRELLLILLLCIALVAPSCSNTDPGDVAALKGLKKRWKNVPRNWKDSDPCQDHWLGVDCSNSRVISLNLFSMNIKGTLGKEIGDLTQLQLLDLSSNRRLRGTLPATLGNLTRLITLRIETCSFSGVIPKEIGNLPNLKTLALNANKLTGKIPPSIGKLSNLVWLDLAENQLSGQLPIKSTDGGGMDQLLRAEHFHLNQNNFSGKIPDIFSASMRLRHLLLDRNQLVGPIPVSIGLVRALEIIRLDNNHLTGSVPSINNLTMLNVLNLANNSLTGSLPNLSSLINLTYIDLSNNQFRLSEAPAWLSNLKNLTTLAIESGQLYGQVPQDIFSFKQLQEVKLKNNSLNGTFDMGNNITASLLMVDLELNNINSVTLSSNYNYSLILKGNPVCGIPNLKLTPYCTDVIELDTNRTQYFNLSKCSNPFSGDLILRAPFFSYPPEEYIDRFKELLFDRLKCSNNNFFIQNYGYVNNYFQFQLHICPVGKRNFNESEILNCFDLNQNLSLPKYSGPSNFNSNSGPTVSKDKKYIIYIAIGGAILGSMLILLGVYAVRQKKRAERERLRNNPFASWHSMGEEGGEAPKLRGAKAFTYDELKMYTNNFKEKNIIGIGGYGKVYRGMLPDKQLVAIKRSKEGSMQGGLEFKTEIELLSRVHHNNLVGLIGFCFEKGERMLVYEYMCNGTLRDCLSGVSGIKLNWSKRLEITLDSATGLAYLHDHANPPIIHRDVKSTNILLDESLTAKVSDFGLSLFVLNSEVAHVTTHIKGTMGYLDPEYYMTQQLTGKSDVYSFGVVMLELITARPPLKNEKYIVREVKSALNKQDKQYLGLKGLIDPILITNNESLAGLDQFLDLALQCVEDEGTSRPTMNEIAKDIKDIMVNSGLKLNSGLSFWKKNNPTRKYSMDMSSMDVASSSSIGNINSSDFRYSGGFPSE